MTRFFNTERFKDDSKLFNEFEKVKVTCEHCGHKVVMTKTDRIICTWCKHYIYADEKAKFKYKMKEIMNKNE